MSAKEKTKSSLVYETEKTVPVSEINARIERRLQEVAKNLRVPGFRPGKVPMPIMKQTYGDAVMGEVLELAVNEISAQELKDKDLRPAMQPKIEVKQFDKGKDLIFTMSVEILPKFEVKDLKGAKFEKLVAKPKDKDIDEALKRIADNNQTTKPIEGKRAAKDGDTIVIDFKGRTAADNVEHAGMAAEGHHLKLGSGQFIPGFEEQLVGKKAGDKLDVNVTFPEQYGAAHLAGQKAIFEITIHEIRESVTPALDDEFAKTLGMDNLDAVKKAITEQLEKEFEYHSRLYLKKSLMDHLDENNSFEIPPGMLEMEYNNIVHQIELERKHHHHDHDHVHDENCNHDTPLTDDEKTEIREIADRRVRLGLILSELGNQNKITVSDAELQRAVIAEAQKYRGQERQVFDYYSKNRNALETLRAPLFEEKVVDFILALATITEKEVSADDLLNAIENEEGALKSSKKSGKAAKDDADKPKVKKKK